MLELNRIYNMDCIQGFSQIESKSVDMVLTDIPYGECSGRNDGIRKINKGDADFVGFELEKLVSELVRVCKGSFYIFCGIKQISNVTNLLQMGGRRHVCACGKRRTLLRLLVSFYGCPR